MSHVRKVWTVDNDGKVGFVMSDEIMAEIKHAITTILDLHREDLVPYSWTLNRTWREDGDQVIVSYPNPYDECAHDFKISNIANAKENIGFSRTFFIEETDRDKVADLCGMIARGEIEVEQ